jgi:SAM-dependent methyltransferase
LAALQELTRTAATAEGVEIDYIAYDPFDDDKAECLMELRNAYPDGDPSSRYFNDIAEVGVKFDRHSFDVAVMCNVLHEIDPDKWVTELGPQSQIARLLRNDGCLLIVEDYGMPVGEKAHAHGFLLLDEAELTRLFRISENDRRRGFFQVLDARPDVPDQRGRLKAILIPAEMLARVTDATRLTAVEELLENSATKMRRLRIAGSDSKSGQRYALAAQLYANAALWLKDRGPRS